jgi:hypothetical protein
MNKGVLNTIVQYTKPNVIYAVYIIQSEIMFIHMATYITLDDAVFAYLQYIGARLEQNNIYDKDRWVYYQFEDSSFKNIFISEIQIGLFGDNIPSNFRYSFVKDKLIRYSTDLSILPQTYTFDMDDYYPEFDVDKTFEWVPTKEFLLFDKNKLHPQ